MPRQILTDFDFVNVSKITNLPNATSDQEPATLAQLKAQIEGLAWKENVRVKTQGNIDLSAPGATVDGVALSANDRFLAGSQTSLPQNGIYIYNGGAVAATRSPDASTYDELESAIVTVDEGSDAGTAWRQTGVNGTIGSSNVAFVAFGVVTPDASETVKGKLEIATQLETDTGVDDTRAVTPLKLKTWAGAPKRFAALVGDNSNTSYVITHNLGTRDLGVSVYRNSGNYDEVMVEVRKTSSTQITLVFSAPPAVNAYQVVVLG